MKKHLNLKVKLLALLTVLTLALSQFMPVIAVTALEEPSIVVSNAKAEAGKTASVAISLKNNPGVVSVTLQVEFDDTALTLKEVKDSGVLGVNAHKPELVNPYTLAWVNDTATENFTVNGTIVTLLFDIASTAKDGDVFPVEVSYNYESNGIMNFDAQKVKFEVVNGSVTVGTPGPNAIEDFDYTTSGKEITITGYKGAATDVLIGSTYNISGTEYTVVAISDEFVTEVELTSLVIPETVTSIGEMALYDISTMLNVTVLGENTVIGDMALGYYRSGKKDIVIEGFTLTGYAGSTAETYATENEITFVALEKECKHEGGEATCKTQAICSKCSESYGELDATNHKGDTEIRDDVAAECNKAGYTGDTYCLDCNTKIADGKEIPATGDHVDADGKWETDGEQHFHTCGCGTKFDAENHKGGEATCKTQAVCEVCKVAYGDLNAANHKGETEIRDAVKETCNKAGYTGDTYCLDCNTKIADGKEIPATGDHVDADGQWETDGEQHFHTCGCGTKFDAENHKGGEATCKTQAECSVCKASYGDLDAANHKGETYKVNQKENSCYETGYTGDTYCADCNTEIAKGEVIAESDHTPAGVWSTNETHHWKDCQIVACGNKIEEGEHKGGEATCKAQAICEVCKVAYGSLNAENHKHTEIRDAVKETCNKAGYTGDTWCKDCETKIADGKEIPATGDHVDADDKWETDGEQHFHTCGCGTKFDAENHKGGEATCKAQAVCEVCKVAYGDLNAANHKGETEIRDAVKETCNKAGYTGDTYCLDCNTKIADGKEIPATGDHVDADDKWEADGEQHFHTCGCGTKFDAENHKGGEATCVNKAECSVCKTAYGSLNSENHKNTEIRDAVKETCNKVGYTGDTWCKDCETKIADGKEIPATGNHVDADGKWETDGEQHFHTCGCGTKFDAENHKGGEATCVNKAECSVCKVAYGSLNAENHKNTEIRDAVKETCNEVGYTGDTWCKDCETKIADGKEISATGKHTSDGKWHHNGEQHYYICECGTKFGFEDHKGGNATCKDRPRCEACDAPYGEKNPEKHTGEVQIKDVKDATCKKEGYTGDTYCKDCNELLKKGSVIEKLPHNVAEWEVTKEPTTESTGVKSGKCTACKETLTVTIAKLVSEIKKENVEGLDATIENVGDTNINENVVFEAEDVTETIKEEEKKTVDEALSKAPELNNHQIGVILDLSLILREKADNGDTIAETELELKGTVKVTVPVPSFLMQMFENIKLIHIKDDGTIEFVPFEFKNGKATFNANGFSYYTFVGTEKTVVEDNKEDVKDDNAPTKDESDKSPATGDASNIILWSAAMLVSVILVSTTVVYRKKRYNR